MTRYSRTVGSQVLRRQIRSSACGTDGVTDVLSRRCIAIASGAIVFKLGERMRRPAWMVNVSRSQISWPDAASCHWVRLGIQLNTSCVAP